MKNTALRLLFLSLLFPVLLCGQGWIHSFEDIFPVEGDGQLIRNGNRYYVAGRGAGQSILFQFDANGQEAWRLPLSFGGGLGPAAMTATNDGGVAAVGMQADAPNLISLEKVDSNGQSEWITELELPDPDGFADYGPFAEVFQSQDGGYVVAAGVTVSFIPYTINLIRFSAQGDSLWRRTLNVSAQFEELIGAAELPDGAFAGIVGKGAGNSDNICRTTIEPFSPDGENLIDISLPVMDCGTHFLKAIQCANGDFLFSGEQNDFDSSDGPRLIRVAADGSIAFSIPLFPEGAAWPVIAEFAGGSVINFGYHPGGGGYGELYLQRRSAGGDSLLFSRRLSELPNSKALGVVEAIDGGYALLAELEGGQLVLVKMDPAGNIYPHLVEGWLFHDQDGDCQRGPGEPPLAGWKVRLAGDALLYATTDDEGRFILPANAGAQSVSFLPPSSYWGLCDDGIIWQPAGDNDTLQLEVGAFGAVDCPLLSVSLSTEQLRRCFDNRYHIAYHNFGAVPAENAYVELTLDSFLAYLGSSIPLAAQDGQVLTFDIGTVGVGEGGAFTAEVSLSCEAELGQAHCSRASIFPDSACISPGWDGPVIVVDGQCFGDSVLFQVSNVGADMSLEQQYIVTEDNIMIREAPFLLGNGSILTVTLPINGSSTYRLEAEQAPGFPTLLGSPYASFTLEGCNGVSPGFATLFSENDGSPFFDIECRENIGSYDPNDKQAFPRGYGDDRFVRPGTELEYLIRFQNTGTDTAFTVIIEDELPAAIDPASVQPGASSHSYTYRLYSTGVLEFRFDNIMLPDSNVNEPASHGFVEFSARPYPDAELGTRIDNRAAIFFDFNEPIITNTAFVTLEENYLISTVAEEARAEGVRIRAYPNPFREACVIEIEGMAPGSGQFLLYDSRGRLVRRETFRGSQLQFRREGLPGGLYFFSILVDGRPVGTGKVVVK